MSKVIRGRADCPLKIQFELGVRSFGTNRPCPYSWDTMKAREWLRGFNFAYFENLAKITK